MEICTVGITSIHIPVILKSFKFDLNCLKLQRILNTCQLEKEFNKDTVQVVALDYNAVTQDWKIVDH